MDRTKELTPGVRGAGRPRVLFVSGEFAPRMGGIADHTAKLAAAMQAAGVVCHVATESRRVDEPAARVHAAAGRLPLQAALATARTARRLRPDVVHLQFQAGAFQRPGEIAGLALLPRLLLARARLAVTFHDLGAPYLFPKAGPLRSALVRRLARAADAAIFVDELDRRAAVAACGGLPRAHWIPTGPGIEPTQATGGRLAARAALGLDAGLFVVGFFGFRQRSKGVGVLAEAMRAPHLRRPDTRLALIGAAAPPLPARRAEPAAPARTFDGLRVIDTGALPTAAVSRWLTACDVVALPFLAGLSTRRGSFMNAAAHGAPIVTTRPPHAGLVDVRPGEVCFVPRNDAAALAQALAVVRDSPGRRRELAAGARAVAARHAWTEIARRTLAAYGC